MEILNTWNILKAVDYTVEVLLVGLTHHNS